MQMLQGEIQLQNYREAIGHSTTARDCWKVVRDTCREMGFCSLRLRIGGETFYEMFNEIQTDSSWQFRITLRGEGQVVLVRSSQANQPALTSFLHVLQETLEAKKLGSEISLAS